MSRAAVTHATSVRARDSSEQTWPSVFAKAALLRALNRFSSAFEARPPRVLATRRRECRGEDHGAVRRDWLDSAFAPVCTAQNIRSCRVREGSPSAPVPERTTDFAAVSARNSVGCVHGCSTRVSECLPQPVADFFVDLVDVVEFDVVHPHSRGGVRDGLDAVGFDLVGQDDGQHRWNGAVDILSWPPQVCERLPAPKRDLALGHVDRRIADVANGGLYRGIELQSVREAVEELFGCAFDLASGHASTVAT